MKICIIINNLGMGGAERLVIDDVNEMLRRGMPVKLITLKPEKDGKSLSGQCKISDSDWTKLDIKGIFDLIGWIRLTKALIKEKPDLLITHLWFSNTLGRICGKLAGVRKVITFEHNVYDELKTGKMFFLDRILQSKSDKIIAVSEAVKKSLIRHNIHEKNIIVIPNGIDTSKFNDAAGANLGTKFKFLFIGRLIYQKGIDILLEAFRQVNDAILIIAGDGDEKERLQDQAKDLEIQNRVLFLGNRIDVPELLVSADCFVLASRYEGLPMVLIEAMAAGKAIIVSDFDSAGEVIKNEENGLIVKRESVGELANAMNRIKSDQNLRNSLAQNAKKDSEKFSIKNHIDRLLSIL